MTAKPIKWIKNSQINKISPLPQLVFPSILRYYACVMTKKIAQILYASIPYMKPSALKGSARLADLFGQLDEYGFKASEKEADMRALQRDWEITGNDLTSAIKSYATTHDRKRQ